MTTLRRPYLPLLATALLLVIATTGFAYRGGGKYQKDIPHTKEKELKVTINAGFGDIYISRGRTDQVLHAAIDADLKNDVDNYIDYATRDNVGYLNINTTDDAERKKGSFHMSDFGTNTWDMHFTDAAPISYDIELGFGKAEFDFTGLAVKDLNLSAGASSVELRFDKPNSSVIEEMNIESGLSKFRAEGLCNANFRNLRFQGGVGSYVLDFGGKIDREVNVDIEVGLGTLTVIIPSSTGAKIEYEKNLINHISLAGDFSEDEEHTYTSENYYDAHGKLNMHIEAGLGTVKIKRK